MSEITVTRRPHVADQAPALVSVIAPPLLGALTPLLEPGLAALTAAATVAGSAAFATHYVGHIPDRVLDATGLRDVLHAQRSTLLGSSLLTSMAAVPGAFLGPVYADALMAGILDPVSVSGLVSAAWWSAWATLTYKLRPALAARKVRVPAPATGAPAAPGPGGLYKIWADHISSETGAHPGQHLVGVQDTGHMWEGLIEAPQGKPVNVTAEAIGSAYRVPAACVSFTPGRHPGEQYVTVLRTPPAELDPTTMEGRWARLVRPKVMPGTHLQDARTDPATGGWVAWVVADDDVPAVPVPDRKQLVGALHSAMTLVDYQPHASNPRKGKIRIMGKNPLEDGVPFPGPQVLEPSNGGYIAIGRGVSGRVARLQLFDPTLGAQHVFIAGVTGSGKGGVVQIVALAAHLAGMAIIYADPKGSSNPDVETMAAYSATGNDTIKSLRVAYALLQHRIKESAGLGRKNFKATPTCPWVMVIVDETHMVTDPSTDEGKEAVFILDKIAALGRSMGMTLLIVNQAVNADKLGGSTAMRMNVIQGGALVMLRTDSAQSNLVTVDGFEGIDPGAIPAAWSAEDEHLVWSDDIPINDPTRTYGLGYVGSPGEPVQMMRSWILESAAPHIHHDRIAWPQDWPAWDDRHNIAETPVNDDDTTPTVTPGSSGQYAPPLARALKAPAEPTADAAVLAVLNDALGLEVPKSDIVTLTGINEKTLSNTLTALVKNGTIERVTPGVYRKNA
ncbi:type IV secretory system conjugative DNA transfer family protein [Streptomyces sp. sk226]|uniref:type IV secretory system conjugative DNA transfer family protein n=1 Tax=Streptomyces sp. sk226 TaxID=2034268 RepID=UPI000BEF763A|nr:type IV secretory system conjugative DNA transfer family protein [Streptomyces sp. sk226]